MGSSREDGKNQVTASCGRMKRFLRNPSQETKKRTTSYVKRDNFFVTESNAGAVTSAKVLGVGGLAGNTSKPEEKKDTIVDTSLRDLIIDKMLFEKR